MAEKIKIEIVDIKKLEFKLLSDAKKGDVFSLAELENVSFESIKVMLEKEKNVLIGELFESSKDKLLADSKEYRTILESNEIKARNIINLENEIENIRKINQIDIQNKKAEIELSKNKEINVLENEIQKLNIVNEKEIEVAKYEISNSKDRKINELENEVVKIKEISEEKIEKTRLEAIKAKDYEINDLEKKLETLEAISEKDKQNIKLEIESVNQNTISKLKNEIEKLKDLKDSEIENAKLKAEKELRNEINILKDQINEKEGELKEIKLRRTHLNSKVIGEELENWINSEASKYLSQLEDVRFEKATMNIEGTKPDFIFNVFDKNGAILTSVTIEAKTESLVTPGKKSNKNHYGKLEKDRAKNKGEYSLLITELDKEDKFLLKPNHDYKNMYVVRPDYFVSFLMIIYNLAQDKKRISELNVTLKEKQEILSEFDTLKADIINKTIKNTFGNIENIEKNANKIITIAESQIEDANKINKNIGTIERKMDGFKINKIVKELK